MSWQNYFDKNKGRPVRPLYLKALEQAAFAEDSKIAIDLGCGAGIETADLLSRGWDVLAIDREPAALDAVRSLISPPQELKLELRCQWLESIEDLPASSFIYAYHSLPFCGSESLGRLFRLVAKNLRNRGIFAGSFFGPNDDWVLGNRATGISVSQLKIYLSNLNISYVEEVESIDPAAGKGRNNFHIIDIIASKGK